MAAKNRFIPLIFISIILCAIVTPAAAATSPAYTITYTISLKDDGSAIWQVDYRAPLVTDEDIAAFNEYADNIDSDYLPQIKELMEHSASQAAAATSRYMEIRNVSGTAVIQTAPTGRYGVILFTFTWEGFARPDTEYVAGDAFAGGMYLPKDATLIIRAPPGYTVKEVIPQPDQDYDGLTWFGVRSFGTGEPHVVFERQPASGIGIAAILVLVTAVIIIGVFLYRRRKVPDVTDEPEDAAPLLSDGEKLSLREQIIQLVRAHGGEMFQSEIVTALGLPKSTVSAALNELHAQGAIVKVKKGRENLIRLR